MLTFKKFIEQYATSSDQSYALVNFISNLRALTNFKNYTILINKNDDDPETKKIIRFLIQERSVNLDLADENGHTALYYAADNKCLKICSMLLKHGARLNLDSMTVALKKDYYNIVQLFLTVTDNAASLLMEALTVTGDKKIRIDYTNKELEKAVADADSILKSRRTSQTTSDVQESTHIQRNKNTALIELIASLSLYMYDYPDFLILDKLISFLILEMKIDLNTTDNQGYTALYHAASKNCSNVCKTLIAAGAKVDLDGKNEPIKLAINEGYSDIVELFLKNGAKAKDLMEVLVATIGARGPLQEEAKLSNLVKLLYSYHANCDVFDKFGEFPNAIVVKTLLDLGVNRNKEDDNGLRLLDRQVATWEKCTNDYYENLMYTTHPRTLYISPEVKDLLLNYQKITLPFFKDRGDYHLCEVESPLSENNYIDRSIEDLNFYSLKFNKIK